MFVHFIDVGQGNMTLIVFPDNTTFLYDCNLTEENESRVIAYLKSAIPKPEIDIFVNSHREADHMRGIKKIHSMFPIKKILDSGVNGTTTDTPEYRDYMELKRNVDSSIIEARKYREFGDVIVRYMNSKNEDLPDPNAQSIVLKIEYGNRSVLLTGDTDYVVWRDKIMPFYGEKVKSSVLLASHHGSISFFKDPNDDKYYYTEHLQKINPDITIISVGDNSFGHPDPGAIRFYEKYSKGSNKGNKIFRTDRHGTKRLELRNDGWTLY